MDRHLKWTGERFLPFIGPESCGVETHYEHLHRYAFAARLVRGKEVLDLASGEGYGSGMLAAAAGHVIGIDIDDVAVEHARAKYPRDNLRFICGSMANVPIEGEGLFDAIVCFGGLEYVEEPGRVLAEVRRLLKGDGIFIVSTPNKNTREGADPFIKKPFPTAELRAALEGCFTHVRYFGQRASAGSDIWQLSPPEGPARHEEILMDGIGRLPREGGEKEPGHIVAVASRRPHGADYPATSALVDVSDAFKGQLLGNSSDAIQILEERLFHATEENCRIGQELYDIKNSIAWRAVTAFDRGVVGRLLPAGTARGNTYELALRACNILATGGPRRLLRRYAEWRQAAGPVDRIASPPERKAYGLDPWNGERLALPPAPECPDVSIVIPVHDNVKYTYNCLRSIVENTEGPYEVIVVDDASSDDTPALLGHVDNVRRVANEANSGFVLSCNRGAAMARGKYLLFLNNDTIVTKGWLKPLLEAISAQDVGAVGSRLIYPNGKLQEAGSIIWKDGTGHNYGRGDDPDKPEYNFVREVDYCSGASLLVRREPFERLGGFDARYRPAYYEDTDLCFSLRQMGYRVLYQPRSVVVHFEGATAGTDVGRGEKRYQKVNQARFAEKWGRVLQGEHYTPSQGLLLARSRAKGKQILVIDHYIPTYDRDAGSLRMYNLLRALCGMGHAVAFMGSHATRMEPYASALQQAGVEVIYPPYSRDINSYIAGCGDRFDLVLLSRAHIASRYFAAVKKYCRNARIVFDTVDLQYLRERRRAGVEKNMALMAEAEKMKRVELGLARSCDMTLVVSTYEREVLLKEDPGLSVEILSIIMEVAGAVPPFAGRSGLLFVGGFAHLPNVDGVEWFVREIFPLVKRHIPDVTLAVAGNAPPPGIKALAGRDTRIAGYVEDLRPYFERARVFVAPLRYGAGVKGKINQSMSFGLPVVTTTIGAEGIGLAEGVDGLIGDTPEEFAEKVVAAYTDEALWRRLSEGSVENVRRNFSFERARENIGHILRILFGPEIAPECRTR